MKFLLLTLIFLSSHLFAGSNIQLQVGSFQSDTFKSAAKYSMAYEYFQRSGLAFEFGASFLHSSKSNQDITQTTLPYAGIKQHIQLPHLPFRLFFGGGFGFNTIPDTYGSNFVGTYIFGGINYHLSRYQFIFAKYQLDYGKTLNDGNNYSFDSHTISVGIGMILRQKNEYKQPKTIQKNPEKLKNNMVEPGRRQRDKRPRKKGGPSNYQKTQDVMKDLSWPTY